jgi:hypothetical protein
VVHVDWRGVGGNVGNGGFVIYLGDIIVVTFHILKAEFLWCSDIPVCGLVGWDLILEHGFSGLKTESGPDTIVE